MEPAALMEYDKLKGEQIARITARDSVLNYNVVALAAVATISVSVREANIALLIAPWVSAIFGWTYVQHEQKITAIGRYIKRSSGTAFGWESEPKRVVLPKLFHQIISILTLVLAFALPCFACPMLWLARSATVEPWMIMLVVVDASLGLAIVTVLIASLDR